MAKEKKELVLIPKVKVHPRKIITYNEIHWFPNAPARKERNNQKSYLVQVEVDGKIELKRISDKFLNSSRQGFGVLSKQAKKRLSLAIDYFLLLNKPQDRPKANTGRSFGNKITFITLTLPSKQKHSDNEIKSKLLNQFLIEISKYDKVTMYIWRAEYQKNGNIHFHILVNRYIHWSTIRNRWNRILNKLGYIDEYRKNMKEFFKDGFKVRKDLLEYWPEEKQKESYQRNLRLDFRDPNSTDIHEIRNITNLKDYLVKYMTKIEQDFNSQLEENLEKKKGIGRIWAASVVLSNIKGARTEIDTEIEEILKYLENHFPERIFRSDYFSVIDFTIDELEQFKCLKLFNLFYEYLGKNFGYDKQLSF